MPEDGYITRSEHAEFAKRIDEENKRQNNRLDHLEKVVESLKELPFLVKNIDENQKKSLKQLEEIKKNTAQEISEIKNKPVKEITAVKQTVLNTIASTITTCIIGALAAVLVLYLSK